jgi:hypothetical protein
VNTRLTHNDAVTLLKSIKRPLSMWRKMLSLPATKTATHRKYFKLPISFLKKFLIATFRDLIHILAHLNFWPYRGSRTELRWHF